MIELARGQISSWLVLRTKFPIGDFFFVFGRQGLSASSKFRFQKRVKREEHFRQDRCPTGEEGSVAEVCPSI